VATALLAVGPCAFALGATFPALLRAVAPAGRPLGARAALLYGVNTVGAVAGALWAGFAGLFDVGVVGMTRLAASGAAAVGLAATGACCLLLLLFLVPVFEDVLRPVRDAAFAAGSPQAAQRRCAIVGSLLLLLAPAVALGAVFPIAVRWAADARPDRLGAATG